MNTRRYYDSLDTQTLLDKVDAYCRRSNAIESSPKLNAGISLAGSLFLGAATNAPALLEATIERLAINTDEFTNPHRYLANIHEAAQEQGFSGLDNIAQAVALRKHVNKAVRGVPSDPVTLIQAEKLAAENF